MANKPENIRFNALRNAIYHSSRRAFLDLTNRSLIFVVVASGASAFADIGKFLSIPPSVLVAVATTAGLIQLVGAPGERARNHEFLQRRFYELVANISECLVPQEADCGRWEAALNRLYAEEPSPMRALDAISYNAALDSLGRDANYRIQVRWWQSLLRQILPFNGTEFELVGSPTKSE